MSSSLRFALTLIVVAITQPALADQVTNMIYVHCQSEDGYFEVGNYHVINGVSPEEHSGHATKETKYFNPIQAQIIHSVPDKMSTYAPIRYKCRLSEKTEIEMILAYNTFSVTGMCGMSPGAKLQLIVNGKIQFHDIPFDTGCNTNVSVHRAIFDASNGWVFCGGGYFDYLNRTYCIDPKDGNPFYILDALKKQRDSGGVKDQTKPSNSRLESDAP